MLQMIIMERDFMYYGTARRKLHRGGKATHRSYHQQWHGL